MMLLVALTAAAAAEEREEEVCVRYETEGGWSKGYAVTASVLSGSELSAKTGQLSGFKPFSTYAVVSWQDDQATILEMPTSSLGAVPMFDSLVRDRRGRQWKIRQGHAACS